MLLISYSCLADKLVTVKSGSREVIMLMLTSKTYKKAGPSAGFTRLDWRLNNHYTVENVVFQSTLGDIFMALDCPYLLFSHCFQTICIFIMSLQRKN